MTAFVSQRDSIFLLRPGPFRWDVWQKVQTPSGTIGNAKDFQQEQK